MKQPIAYYDRWRGKVVHINGIHTCLCGANHKNPGRLRFRIGRLLFIHTKDKKYHHFELRWWRYIVWPNTLGGVCKELLLLYFKYPHKK